MLPPAVYVRARDTDGVADGGDQWDRLQSYVELALGDAGQIVEVVDHARQVSGLVTQNLERLLDGVLRYRGNLFQHHGRREDRGHRIAQLVSQHGQKLVLPPIRGDGRLVETPALQRRRGQIRKCAEHALVLSVEVSLLGVRDDPERAHGLAVAMDRNEQNFDEARLGREGREGSIRQVHQLGCVLVDADAARTRGAG